MKQDCCQGYQNSGKQFEIQWNEIFCQREHCVRAWDEVFELSGTFSVRHPSHHHHWVWLIEITFSTIATIYPIPFFLSNICRSTALHSHLLLNVETYIGVYVAALALEIQGVPV